MGGRGGGGDGGDDDGGDNHGRDQPPRPPPRQGPGDGDGGDDDGSDDERAPGIRGPHENLLQRLRVPMPEAYSGDGDTTFTEWQVVMCRWLRSNGLRESRWLPVFVNNLKGAAMKWMNLTDLQVARGQREPFPSWREWANEARQKFEPTTLEEMARAQLRKLRQLGSVQSYVRAFQNVCFRIPDLTEGEAYSVFTGGLKQPIRNQVVGLVRNNLEEAIAMAERLDSVHHLAGDHAPKPTFAPKRFRPRRPQVNTVQAPQPDHRKEPQVAMVQHQGQKKRRGAPKKYRRPIRCYTCGKLGHTSPECPQKGERKQGK